MTGTLFNRLGHLGIDGTTLALMGQEAENQFVGIEKLRQHGSGRSRCSVSGTTPC